MDLRTGIIKAFGGTNKMSFGSKLSDLFQEWLSVECGDELHTDEDLVEAYENPLYWEGFVKFISIYDIS